VLRQSYVRVGKQALIRYQRYAHAKQFKRANRALKRIRTLLGRVIRDLTRKIAARPELADVFVRPLALARRVTRKARYRTIAGAGLQHPIPSGRESLVRRRRRSEGSSSTTKTRRAAALLGLPHVREKRPTEPGHRQTGRQPVQSDQSGAMPFSLSSRIAFSFLDSSASPMPRSTCDALVNWMFS
jgi:hypothetical protein